MDDTFVSGVKYSTTIYNKISYDGPIDLLLSTNSQKGPVLIAQKAWAPHVRIYYIS